MMSISYTSSSVSNRQHHFLSLQSHLHSSGQHFLHIPEKSAFLRLRLHPTNPPPLPLRASSRVCSRSNRGVGMKSLWARGRRSLGVVCYAAPPNLQWISTVSTAVLMLARGTAIQKSFLVPLFALQAPASIISTIKGNYGIWIAFIALFVRLFYYIPGDLELPFMALLTVIVAPYQVMNLRGTQEGVILSLVIAAYLAFQHFSRAGSLQRAFDQGSIIATLAVVCVIAVPCLLLI